MTAIDELRERLQTLEELSGTLTTTIETLRDAGIRAGSVVAETEDRWALKLVRLRKPKQSNDPDETLPLFEHGEESAEKAEDGEAEAGEGAAENDEE